MCVCVSERESMCLYLSHLALPLTFSRSLSLFLLPSLLLSLSFLLSVFLPKPFKVGCHMRDFLFPPQGLPLSGNPMIFSFHVK